MSCVSVHDLPKSKSQPFSKVLCPHALIVDLKCVQQPYYSEGVPNIMIALLGQWLPADLDIFHNSSGSALSSYSRAYFVVENIGLQILTVFFQAAFHFPV